MKKKFKHLSTLLLLIVFIFITACTNIKEYKDVPITKLTYTTIDYNGGYTENKTLDFINNQYIVSSYIQGIQDDVKSEIIREFSETEEKEFINGCYSNGLFDLRESYKSVLNVIDGGEWNLTLDYENGTSKKSKGRNNGPYTVFNNCSVFFYNICKEEVIGTLPANYYYPPNISLSFRYELKNGIGFSNFFARKQDYSYKWNKFTYDANLYDINLLLSEKNNFLEGFEYGLVLSTANYHYKDEFNKIIIKNYDFNENCTNEKEVYNGSFFSQKEFSLEINKIYTYELQFKNGDYLKTTFNTKVKDSKILIGKYRYSIYEEGSLNLEIGNDNSFVLHQFEYFDETKNVNKESISGEYSFEMINEKEYFVLKMTDKTIIVFEYYAYSLFVNFEHTTFDLASYHLESKKNMDGEIEFSFES